MPFSVATSVTSVSLKVPKADTSMPANPEAEIPAIEARATPKGVEIDARGTADPG